MSLETKENGLVCPFCNEGFENAATLTHHKEKCQVRTTAKDFTKIGENRAKVVQQSQEKAKNLSPKERSRNHFQSLLVEITKEIRRTGHWSPPYQTAMKEARSAVEQALAALDSVPADVKFSFRKEPAELTPKKVIELGSTVFFKNPDVIPFFVATPEEEKLLTKDGVVVALRGEGAKRRALVQFGSVRVGNIELKHLSLR